MKVLLKSDGLLILRDGHPFGDIGVVDGHCRQWPLAQTLAGMIRTKIGFSIAPDYFDSQKNCDEILNSGLKRQMPVTEDGNFLVSVPHDIVFSQVTSGTAEEQAKLTVNIPELIKLDERCGTDIQNRDWLIPYLELKDKPAKETPFFLKWDVFMRYIQEDLTAESSNLYEFGTSAPISDIRLHNAIDASSLTSNKGQLFSNQGIYLMVRVAQQQTIPVNLWIDVDDQGRDINITGDAYLGGERKTVFLQKSEMLFPECPDFFTDKQFLKLILTTHGDFGNWVPDWLMPDLSADKIEWVTIPQTDYKIRLRSAYISGHDTISGWDYASKQAKASKKLVPPGAVYIIEMQNPHQSQAIANLFWGNSLDINNKTTALNGYGQLLIGNITIK